MKNTEEKNLLALSDHKKDKFGYVPNNVKQLRRAAKHYKVLGLQERLYYIVVIRKYIII